MKTIEHGMSIKCSSYEQGDALVEELQKQGYEWNQCDSEHYTERDTVCFIAYGKYNFHRAYIANTRFEDLMLNV